MTPLEDLLVDERDIPKLRYQERKAAEQKAEARRRGEVRRFTLKSGNIIDVIGNGIYTRIWIGENENATAFGTLDQDEFRQLSALYSEAMGTIIIG